MDSAGEVQKSGKIRVKGPNGKYMVFPKGTPIDVIDSEMSRFNANVIDVTKPLPYKVTKGADTGSALGNIWDSVKNAVTSPLIPAEKFTRSVLPEGNTGAVGEAAAGAGIGASRLIEQFSTPSTAALGVGAGLAGSVGLPGFILNAGLSAEMLRHAWDNAMADLPKGSLPRDKYANYITAALDAAMAALPFTKRAPGPSLPKGTTRNTLRGLVGAKPKEYQPSAPDPVGPSTSPAPPSLPFSRPEPSEPIAEREPWYAARDRQEAKKKAQEEDIFGDPPSGPLPEVSMGPKGDAMKMVEDATTTRMNDIADLFESGLGSLSGKGKTVEGIEDMSYSGSQGVQKGFGKIRVKGAAVPEIAGMKESPSKIAQAIRKDGNNPLYLRVKDAVKQDINSRYGESIAAISSGERSPDGFYDYENAGVREPGEEGFADIKKNKPSLPFVPMDIPGQSKTRPMEVLLDQILHASDSSVSKRDLLGIDKKKKKSVGSSPLFDDNFRKLF